MENTTNEQIMAAYAAYIAENEKFENKGVAAAGTRARAALGDIAKLAKIRRLEIQSKKNEAKAAK